MKVELEQNLINDIKRVVENYDNASLKHDKTEYACYGIVVLKQILKSIEHDKEEFDEYVEDLANSIY